MTSLAPSRFVFLAALTVIALGFGPTVQGQVLHMVPKKGQWVELDGENRSFEGTTQSVRARFACVATEKLDEKTAAWIEVEWTRHDQADTRNYPFRMKLLVPTKLTESDDPRRVKCRTLVKYPEEPALRPAKTDVSEEVIADIRGRVLGCVPSKAVLTEVGDEEILIGERKVKTKAKLYRYTQTDSDGDKVEYRFWLAPEIPFGVAKYAYRLTRADGSGRECEMTLYKHGDDAEPQWNVPEQ